MAKIIKSKPGFDTVDSATVEAVIQAKKIGQKIRRLRLKRSMGLAELGLKVGLSASFLSQLETGRVIPTMRNLARIAIAFKKDFSYFLADEETSVFRVSRASDRIRLAIEDKGTPIVISDNIGMLLQDRNTVPCIADFIPGHEDAAFHPRKFSGLELVYVMSGNLVLATAHKTEVLFAQDSAWVDGNTSRHYRCHDEQPARAMIMTFTVEF